MLALMRRVQIGSVVLLTLVGCAIAPDPELRHIPGTESMPAPASVWLTADPASPTQEVTIEMTSPDSDMRRTHTFAADAPMRGSFPVSQGRYRLTAQSGACTIDLDLSPEHEADVVVKLRDDGCEFAVALLHRYDSGVTHPEPAVLVAPGSVP